MKNLPKKFIILSFVFITIFCIQRLPAQQTNKYAHEIKIFEEFVQQQIEVQ